MLINFIIKKFHFDEHQQDTRKCDWLIGHIISFVVHYNDLLHNLAINVVTLIKYRTPQKEDNYSIIKVHSYGHVT